MIYVRDWVASIPDEDKHIAYVGEGKSEQKEFLLTGKGWEAYKDWAFHLDMAFDPTSITTRDSRQVVQTTVNSSEHTDETGVTKDAVTTKETYTVDDVQVTNHYLTDIAPLTKQVTDGGILLTWNILRQHTVLPGKLWATLRAVDGTEQRIKKSAIMTFEVEAAICAVPATVPPISEFEQMEQSMDALRLQVEEAASNVQHASAVATIAAESASSSMKAATAVMHTVANHAAQVESHHVSVLAHALSVSKIAEETLESKTQAIVHADLASTSAKQAQAHCNTAQDAATSAMEQAAQSATAATAAEDARAAAEDARSAAAQEANQAAKQRSQAEQAATFAGNARDEAVAALEEVKKEIAVGGDELTGRVTTVENTLFGGTTEVTPEPIETATITNLLKNSHFDDGLTSWSFEYKALNQEVVDGELYLHDMDSSVSVGESITQTMSNKDVIALGHKYYTSCRIKLGGVYPSGTLKLYPYGSGLSTSTDDYTDPVLNEWSYMTRIATVTAISKPDSSRRCRFYITYDRLQPTATVRLDDLVLIDLTAAFGEGNEPDLATMDRWMKEQFPNGFDGSATLAMTPEDDGAGDSETTVGLVAQVADLENEVDALSEQVKEFDVGSITQTGTVHPVLASYYIANIDEARPKYYNAQEANSLTFAMLADIHLITNQTYHTTISKSLEAASAWAKLVNHDFVMLGGDLIVDYYNKPTALSLIDDVVEMAEKHARCPVYAVKGNHDTNEGVDHDTPAYRLTDKEFYIHANARSEKFGMVTDPDYPFNGYYYVDFPKQKIRMVCLNTSENKHGVDIYGVDKSAFRYSGTLSPTQLAWVKETALRVDEGWAVMAVSHIPPLTAANFNNRGKDYTALRAVYEAFASGTGEFAEQGAREFIGHFSGHAHIDAYNEVNGLNYVIVNCTTPEKRQESTADATYLDRNLSGDETTLSLNSFIIDRATHTVKCIKIGTAPAEDYAGWVDSFTWNAV